MNGVHDMGGTHGFGPVRPEPHDAEGQYVPPGMRAMAVMFLMSRAGLCNGDEQRWAIEQIEPAEYLGSDYFRRWQLAAERLLAEKGVATADELAARWALVQANPAAPLPAAGEAATATARAILARLPQPAAGTEPPSARFRAGDRVMTRNTHPVHHTRLPRYARGKRGEVAIVNPVAPLPDARAHGLGPNPQTVYTVRFPARELWGESAEPNASVSLDLWECYLDPAE